MRSVRALFEAQAEEGISTFLQFVRAIRGQGFSRDKISRNLRTLVDPDDYSKSETTQILNWLQTI